MIKRLIQLEFFISLLSILAKVPLSTWIYFIIIYFILICINLKNVVLERFPFGEFISLVFFIENTFALSLIYIIKGTELPIGMHYYSLIALEEYLPFSFIASQALFLGCSSNAIQKRVWKNSLTNFRSLIEKEDIVRLVLLGLVGTFMASLNIAAISYVSYILTNFFSCALIGLALYYKKPANIYVLAGLAWNLLVAIRGGMFGALIYFIAYYLLLYTIQQDKKVNWAMILFVGASCIWLLALLQIVKGNYREAVWTGEEAANTETFSKVVVRNVSLSSVTDIDFYLPVLFRLNQGFLVSAVMQKVPDAEPFAKGLTIISAIRDAFVPRFLDPEKEEAGGRQKMERFTNITLVGSTSMNIGLLGEAYANFGKVGGVFFLTLYGFILGFFERKILNFSFDQPISLVLFPIYFQILVGSGTDFLSVVNAVVKNTVFLMLILYLFYSKKEKGNLEIKALS